MDMFLKTIFSSHGREAALYAGEILNAFALPCPDAGQFYSSTVTSQCHHLQKQILFLTDYGIAMRFYAPYEIYDHDNLLQPLIRVDGPSLVFDAVKIIETGVKNDEYEEVVDNLFDDGIQWGDQNAHNVGYLTEDNLHSVVIDICYSIEELACGEKSSVRWGSPLQKKIFAPLTAMAMEAFGGNIIPEPRSARKFLYACKNHFGNAATRLQKSCGQAIDMGQTASAYAAAMGYAKRTRDFAF